MLTVITDSIKSVTGLLRKCDMKMCDKIIQIGDLSIKVFRNYDSNSLLRINAISKNDAEMDKRAIAAVRSAIIKAKVCNKPIAKYDIKTQKTYLDYPDGSRKYFN